MAALVPAARLSAAESAFPPPHYSPAEAAFIALDDEYHTRLNEFWRQLDELPESTDIDQFCAEHDPKPEYLPKLLAFEREHAGEDVGLDALAEVVSSAVGGGGRDQPEYIARRQVLARLPRYEDRQLAARAVASLVAGDYDPQIVDYLRRLADSPQADRTVRATAQLKLAAELLSLSRQPAVAPPSGSRTSPTGMPIRYPTEVEVYKKWLAGLPPADQLAADRDAAIALLESLAADSSLREPVYRAVDPTQRLRRIDSERSATSPTFATRAAALLFNERHLSPGQPAPELALTLIDGRPWSLDDERGHFVLIQFSFTGLRPCAEMYPQLRQFQQESGDRLSILTIMRDATPDHALEATHDGTITWNVTSGRKICDRWSVNSFPTIYLIDPTGQLLAAAPRGEQLHWQISKLLAAKH